MNSQVAGRLEGVAPLPGRDDEAGPGTSEALLAAILDSATDYAIVTTDLAGTITSWNAGARHVLGWDESEAVGRSADLFFTPEDRAAEVPRAEMSTALARGRAEDERWHLRRDGARFWASGLMMPLRPARGGEAFGFVKILRDRTEQRQREALLGSVFEATGLFTGVVEVLDEDYRYVVANRNTAAFYGRPERGMDGLLASEAGLGRREVDGWLATFRGCLAEGRPLTLEHSLRRDGEVTGWYLGTYTPLPGAPSGRPRVSYVIIDVTETKRAEARARESEARFRAIADSIDQMIWSTRPDGYHDFYNQRWYDYTGVPAGSTDGEAWNGMFHPEDQARAWRVWGHCLATGEPYHIEYRLRHRSGRYRWVLGRAQPVRDEHGAIARWFGTCTDIQDLVEAREVLARSREELERQVAERTEALRLSEEAALRLYNRSPIPQHSIDADGRYLAVSDGWCELMGYAREEALGSAFFAYVAPHETERLRAAFEVLHEKGEIRDFEYDLVAKDGTPRPVMVTTRVEYDQNGHFLRTYGVTLDLRARKAAEAALREAEEQLRQAQKMEAVGQLTGGIAHDFNNLLTGIVGSLDLLQTRVAQGRTAEIGRYVETATTSAKRAAALTHRLLAFARRQPLDPKPVDVNRLVLSMEELIRRTIGVEIALDLALAPTISLTRCDAHQLESALLNLVINARDAMPEGQGRLRIATADVALERAAAAARGVPPGTYVRLSVADDGTGMPAPVAAKAFDPFFTTKPIGQGTGLGLSMTYGFVRQSGGAVAIDSAEGRGTTVTIDLPRYDGPVEDDASTPAAAAPAEARDAAGETVLVVEDEPAVRMLVLETLGDLGLAAREAADGPAGLAILRSEARVDLLVTDVGLPGMNGRHLAETARTLRPGLKVLFITGYAEKAAVRDEFLGEGMDLIGKPFTLEALAARIRTMLRGAGAASRTPGSS